MRTNRGACHRVWRRAADGRGVDADSSTPPPPRARGGRRRRSRLSGSATGFPDRALPAYVVDLGSRALVEPSPGGVACVEIDTSTGARVGQDRRPGSRGRRLANAPFWWRCKMAIAIPTRDSLQPTSLDASGRDLSLQIKQRYVPDPGHAAFLETPGSRAGAIRRGSFPSASLTPLPEKMQVHLRVRRAAKHDW